MRTTQCLLSSRIALYRVFISTFEQVEPTLLRRPILSTPTRAQGLSGVPRTSFIQSSPTIQSRGLVRRAWKANLENAVVDRKSKLARLPRDDEIEDREVMVVDQNNQMTGPHLTSAVLRSLDPTTHSLRVVQAASPSGPREGLAICKVVDRTAEEAVLKARKEADKASKQSGKLKEMELNWAIAPHDLEYKMKNLVAFLEKGYRVEVLLAKKKKSRTATAEERKELLRKVMEMVETVPGAKEWKSADGDVGKSIKLYLGAPAPKSS